MERSDIFNKDDVILAPFIYLTNNSGKGLRRNLIKAFNWWLNIEQEKLEILGDVIETLHNASLVIDDIEDGSHRRRGKPAAHMLFGVPLSINAANYAYFIALEKALTLGHVDVPKIFTEQMLDLHRGQGLDIYWRCSLKCPSECEYRDMVIRKTGGLIGMAVKLMQLFSTNNGYISLVLFSHLSNYLFLFLLISVTLSLFRMLWVCGSKFGMIMLTSLILRTMKRKILPMILPRGSSVSQWCMQSILSLMITK
uniref:Geranylgeranyl pyrophosphate synthase n=1 Tax=Mesocestoides corti TaxID=53468 RepID=A0A5K3EUX4_MESCO